MRIVTVLVASSHLCLVACQPGPGSLLPPPSGPGGLSLLASTPAEPPPPPSKTPTPYMRCVTDFWGNCTGVASNRHKYRWRYVRPGARPKDMRESATARANIQQEEETNPIQKAVFLISPPAQEKPAARKGAAEHEKAAVGEQRPAHKAAPAPREPAPRQSAQRETTQRAPAQRAPRQKTVAVEDNKVTCHARRRVIGEERLSQDDARRAAENGWMGAVRYDYGERYQDINRAKDVRLSCGPSSVSSALRQPHFRCAVEATPCRQTKGEEVDEQRSYEAPRPEDRISRK